MTPVERANLRASVDLENRSDLMAVACDFGGATRLMREANRLRAEHFGLNRGADPNHLRALTVEALTEGAGDERG